MSQFTYHIHVSPTDASVAFDCEADRAQKEGFPGVEKRQRETALHIRNAWHHLAAHTPPGFRVQTTISFEVVPDVNPRLRDDVRENRR